MKTAIDRLMAKTIKQGDCLVWTGGTGRAGYGTFHYEGKNRSAHRVSYLLHKGEIPAGMVVMHSCDNRLCINPEHLRLGTHADNTDDMMAKGRNRQPAGVQHCNAKITPEVAAEIRRRFRPYDRQHGSCALARELGISQATVHSVVRGVTWKQCAGAA